MQRRKREYEKQPDADQAKEYVLEEAMRTDLRESFDFFKSDTGKISRENVKSIMSNFGWLNCSSSDLERSIDKTFPSADSKQKQDFTLQEVKSQ
jgi:Ca2+-binding EF-hand superfamily protein